jgi:hypothetical protein
MSDNATDSVPSVEETTKPSAKGLTMDQAAEKFKGLFGPKSEEKAEPAGESQDETPAEGDEQAEDDPLAQEEQAEQPSYKVRVDGEEMDVPLDELLRGYSRTADYTRKTQAVAEQRKTLEAELEQARAERNQYEQALQWAKGQLESQKQDEPDWERLLNEDPIEYVKRKEAWRDRKEQLAAVQAEQRRIQEQKQQEFAVALQKKVEEESRKLNDLIPDWRDSKKAEADKARLLEYGLKLGFTQQELTQVYDHRAVLMLHKARLYDELMAKGKQKLSEAPVKSPATARPGSPANRQVNKELDSARSRLKTSGRVTDAQAVLERMFASR